MKFYVTKYALTQGILEVEVAAEDVNSDYVYCKAREGSVVSYSFRLGKDAFLSREEAVARVRKLVAAKVKNLKKQIEKLESLKF